MDFDKTYKAIVEFGTTTTTQDYTGEIISQKKVDFNEDKIKEAVFSFVGEYEQVPPMYSAIKINGKKIISNSKRRKNCRKKSKKSLYT